MATILCDFLKAFDHVAYQKMIDLAALTDFLLRQLRLLVRLHHAARHAAAGAAWHDSGMCVRNHSPPAIAGGVAAGGARGAPNRVHPRRGRRPLADHDRVAQELENASNLRQGLSNTVFVRAKLLVRVAPLSVQASRADRNLGVDCTSGK